MRNTAPLVYPSAVDRWLLVLLLAPIVTAIAFAAYLYNEGRADDAGTMALMAAAIAAVTGVFTIPCRYTLLDDALSIRCGLICYQVAYTDITDVAPSSTWTSGPALSLKRVVVRTAKREHILSPEQRERFIEELNARVAPSMNQLESETT